MKNCKIMDLELLAKKQQLHMEINVLGQIIDYQSAGAGRYTGGLFVGKPIKTLSFQRMTKESTKEGKMA